MESRLDPVLVDDSIVVRIGEEDALFIGPDDRRIAGIVPTVILDDAALWQRQGRQVEFAVLGDRDRSARDGERVQCGLYVGRIGATINARTVSPGVTDRVSVGGNPRFAAARGLHRIAQRFSRDAGGRRYVIFCPQRRTGRVLQDTLGVVCPRQIDGREQARA